MERWLTGIALVMLSLVVGIGLSLSLEQASPTQPIAFSHKKHAGKLSLPCITCHQWVATQSFAGLPQTELCMGCHRTPLTKDPEEEKTRIYAAKGEKIPWQRIDRVPRDIFFSHRRHVVLAKVECATCHGNMAEQATPPLRPLVNQPMAWCIACHQERRASVDCNGCHR